MPQAPRVLVVDDEPALSEAISYNLEREGMEVRVVASGTDALAAFRGFRPSLVILDLMLPGINGLDVCKRLRQESSVPILMLTAKDSEADRVTGLELGADDYVTKPFSMRELVSRVRAQLRRATMTREPEEHVMSAGPVVIDPERHEVRVNDSVIELRPKEFALLELLVRRAGRLVTRDQLIDEVWGPDYYGDTKTLDVHIRRLREKVEEDPKDPRHILTVRGLGYKFEG